MGRRDAVLLLKTALIAVGFLALIAVLSIYDGCGSDTVSLKIGSTFLVYGCR